MPSRFTPPPREAVADAPAPVRLPFPVVGLGASAGGLSALKRVLGAMPVDSGMAFVVVVHLSPSHDSEICAVLQQATAMPVHEVTRAMQVEADHVYVIAPMQELALEGGLLRGTPRAPAGKGRGGRAGNTTIDLFFRSLAQAQGERAVAVVLSGTGADGTQGLKRIKELGGVTLAQSPEDAELDDMPRSAIGTGQVDIVLPSAELPRKLCELWRNAQRLQLPAGSDDAAEPARPTPSNEPSPRDEQTLLEIQTLLRERSGHDFAHYKRATVLRRLERRLQVNALPDLASYLGFLRDTAAESQALLQDMLISVTQFFRDREAFDALALELAKRPRQEVRDEPYRAWVAGCATGEEAFSIAILLDEAFVTADTSRLPVQVFASDIDQRAIDLARAGAYPESIATDVPPLRLLQHFTTDAGGWRIGKRIRDTVLFSNHNVLRDPPFTRVDLVCCRNLLIYLDRQAQAQLLRTFHYALQPGGLLFLGSSESADGLDDLFEVVDKRHRLYRSRGAPRSRGAASFRAAPGAAQAHAAPPGEPLPRSPMAELHRRVLARQAPPTVLIDAEHGILHVDAGAAHLLRLPGGSPSNRLLDLVRPELRVELRTALFRAAETQRSVESAPVRLSVDGVIRHLGIGVKPVQGETPAGLLLVVFDEAEISLAQTDGAGDGAGGGDAEGSRHPLVQALEAELAAARKQIQDTAGDSAAFTEELRASNEELQSINEELRSATEELETSREELHSMNEELVTVNEELRHKVVESAKGLDDLQNLIASADIGTIFVDRETRIKLFTPRAAKLFNLIGTDRGRPLLDITHRLDYPQLADDVTEIFKSLARIEREVSGPEGSRFLARLLPYRTREDRIDGAVLTFLDVSDLRRAERSRELSEQRLRLVADGMLDFAIITFDIEGVITSWSAGAEAVFGYGGAEAVGRTADLIFTAEDRRNGVPAEEFRRARESGHAEDDRWHRRKDGRTFFCSGIMGPLRDDGELVGYAKIARDLTHSKLLDAQRDAMMRTEAEVRGRLEEASVMKDELMAVLAHELKNPLNLIHLNTELLLRMPQVQGHAAVARAAGTIRKAVTSQSQIIDDLFDMSRLTTRKLVLTSARVELQPLVERIVAAVAHDAAARSQAITLHAAEPSASGIAVFGDAVRIEQIVWNLVTNAQKFTPAGGHVSVELSVDDGMARVDVTDTGVGLEPRQIYEVFEMFRQLDSGAGRGRGGLGIGLALVKRMTELQGGRVRATSPGPGLGSTFSAWLPLDREDAVPPDDAGDASALRGVRLLLVDDRADAASAFAEILRLEGAEVCVVDSAVNALQRLAEQTFDIVLSDIAMPVHDGYWLIQQLRADDRLHGQRVIAVSGLTAANDRKRVTEAGFDAQLGKPLQLELLRAEIANLLAPRS